MIQIIKTLIILILALSIYSCRTNFLVEVDGLKDENAVVKTKYYLMPSNEGVNINDLQFKEFSKYVKIALTKKGFEEVPVEEAEIAIYFSYGIGDPLTHTYSYSYPVFGEIEGNTKTIDVRTYNSSGSTTNTYGTIKTKPKYGVTGYVSGTGTKTTYFRFATLEAVDLDYFKETGEYKSIWQTNITSSGSNNDLRLVMPIMIAGSLPYISENTERKIKIKLKEDDYSVLGVKGMKVNYYIPQKDN